MTPAIPPVTLAGEASAVGVYRLCRDGGFAAVAPPPAPPAAPGTP